MTNPRAKKLVVGIAWWRPQDWNRLREISDDRQNLEDSHREWLENDSDLDSLRSDARFKTLLSKV